MTEKDPKLMSDLQDILEGDGPTQDAARLRVDLRYIGSAPTDPGVTAVVPCIPPRTGAVEPGTLPRALKSILSQTRRVEAVSLAFDYRHEGAAVTRNRALGTVRTEWTAFLDDDDVWLPDHIERLVKHAEETGADLVYPWFHVPGGFDPFPQYAGKPFDPDALRDVQNYIPVTVLVKTRLAQSVGGFSPLNRSTAESASPCEEWGLWLRLLDAGAVFSHLPHSTWEWHWHAGNTSGRGDRW